MHVSGNNTIGNDGEVANVCGKVVVLSITLYEVSCLGLAPTEYEVRLNHAAELKAGDVTVLILNDLCNVNGYRVKTCSCDALDLLNLESHLSIGGGVCTLHIAELIAHACFPVDILGLIVTLGILEGTGSLGAEELKTAIYVHCRGVEGGHEYIVSLAVLCDLVNGNIVIVNLCAKLGKLNLDLVYVDVNSYGLGGLLVNVLYVVRGSSSGNLVGTDSGGALVGNVFLGAIAEISDNLHTSGIYGLTNLIVELGRHGFKGDRNECFCGVCVAVSRIGKELLKQRAACKCNEHNGDS